jgi:hypothetical protein
MFQDKEGDASGKWNKEGEQVNKSKEREGAACGDSIDLNSIHNDRKCEEIARKE